MNLSDAIIIAAAIIAVGAVSTVVVIKSKNKIVSAAVIAFLFIVAISGLIFKSDIVRLFDKQGIIKSNFVSNHKKLSYKDLDISKLTIDDILFYFAKEKYVGYRHLEGLFLSRDSTFFISGSFYKSAWYDHFYKDSIKKYIDVNYCNDFGFFNRVGAEINDLYAFVVKDRQVEFMGDYSGYKKWPLQSIFDNFGHYDKRWISVGDLVRIYQIDNQFFFCHGSGRPFAKGISRTADFDPTSVLIFNEGLKYKLVE